MSRITFLFLFLFLVELFVAPTAFGQDTERLKARLQAATDDDLLVQALIEKEAALQKILDGTKNVLIKKDWRRLDSLTLRVLIGC